jgi:hypothetical protein
MKIPFEATISGAYRFAFTNFLSILGIAWFPFVALFAVMGGVVVVSLPALKAALPEGQPPAAAAPQAIALIVGLIFLFVLAWIVAVAMVNVGIMRKALGQHPAPVFFFFSLGGQVWRLIGSYIVLSILIFFGIIATEIAIFAASFGLQHAAPSAAVPVTVVLVIIAVCWWIYAGVRVMFFIPAVVVAEDHIGISRSWELGGGNFWRILGIQLIATVPLVTAAGIIISTLMQIGGGSTMMAPAGSPPDPARALQDMQHAFATVGPYLVIVELVYLILLSGLTNGAAATAYNLVTGNAGTQEPA